MSQLPAPHGGRLCQLLVTPAQADALRLEAATLPAWDLSPRQRCDLELLLNGGFSPLTGFMGQADYDTVVSDMRLADGTLWPMPVTLDVSSQFAEGLAPGARIALRGTDNTPLAILTVNSLWQPDLAHEAEQVFGTSDRLHPGVAHLLQRSHPVYVGGTLEGIQLPAHYDFVELRDTPAELRERLQAKGWSRVVAFQTRNPLHRAHRELTLRAAERTGAKLLIHPVVGMTKPGDVDHYTRVRCYQALMANYPEGLAALSLLPLAMRMGGPREAVWHAIIRKNYGCTHFIVGRDHAGPGKDSNGQPFYGAYDAQELLAAHAEEIGVEMVPFEAVVYAENRDAYIAASQATDADTIRDISGTELRQRLHEGADIPDWFSFPEIVSVLRERYPAGRPPGFALFFTGLSGAGKSTLAQAVISLMMERSSRPVTLLDGDEVRKHLSKGLGFSREDRDANVTRIGWVASEIVRHGGIAVCAPIAPFAQPRSQVRALCQAHGGFCEIHVATSLDVCESRDRKGLYAAARRGEIKQFTGISDPYEVPENPELRIDAGSGDPRTLAMKIIDWIEQRDWLR
ncbi:MAG: bifunctional sulfate adenylyltransferase/adenylylsulfate kinase [Xanthomonadales bacterium]|nr:bifunctional sulfate adenylyltransferase/adenylylsulfate kinase [Xanthomonadales bacterium]